MRRFSGLAAIRKPAGQTSFAALGPIKRSIGTGKVGHAGTLDRFATGLLLVLVGPYAHLTPFFSSLDKRYKALVRFGKETDTLDPEGSVIAEADVPSPEALGSVLPQFRGPILQSPPAYSAIHLGGKRAYERVLAGEKVEPPARPVTIHELVLDDFTGCEARFSIRCSSGTYVRSLARDIALACGSRASLGELERVEIGPIALNDAVEAAAFLPERDLRRLEPSLAWALGLRPRLIEETSLRAFRNGGLLDATVLSSPEAFGEGTLPEKGEGLSAVFGLSGDFLGVVEEGSTCLAYRFVIGEDL